MAVDPSQKIGRNLTNPQRWNRYSYGLNNPIKYIDPDGRDIEVPSNMRGAMISSYTRSSEFRAQFDAAKKNPQIHARLKLDPDVRSTEKEVTKGSKPPGTSGDINVTVTIPPGKGNDETGALTDHALKHVNDIAKTGDPQTPGTPGAVAGEAAAKESEAKVRADFKDTSDDVPKGEAEKALEGTEPKKEEKKEKKEK